MRQGSSAIGLRRDLADEPASWPFSPANFAFQYERRLASAAGGPSFMALRTGHGARPELRLTDAQRKLLNTWARAGTTPQRVARRVNAVLLAADGLSARLIANRLRISPRTAALWPRRYVQGGHETLWRDAPGRGRRPSIDAAAVSRVRTLVKTAAPEGGRWSIRRLAKATGLSRASVHRIVRGNW